EAAERAHVVLLELLAGAASIAGLPPAEVAADQLVVELDARGDAADDDRKARSVGLAGGGGSQGPRVATPIPARCDTAATGMTTPTRWPSGSLISPSSIVSMIFSGPSTRVPPRLSALASAASTSSTAT